MVIRVQLDTERLRGKWQTLCIDLGKIIGKSRVNVGSRLELTKMVMMAAETQVTEVYACFGKTAGST